MTTTHPVEIGGSAIDKTDPWEVTERIQYLVKHEMPFTEFQDLLETLLQYQEGHDWTVYEEFLALLKEYRGALDAASVHSGELRDKVAGFSAYRR